MIRLTFTVDEYYATDNSASFSIAVSKFRQRESVKYLYEHCKEPAKIEHYKKAETFETVWCTWWDLPGDRETYFFLKWGDELG